jgi:hypothetical protein
MAVLSKCRDSEIMLSRIFDTAHAGHTAIDEHFKYRPVNEDV